MTDEACCACLTVEYKPIETKPGRMQSRWMCKLCGREFTATSVVATERARCVEIVRRQIKEADDMYDREGIPSTDFTNGMIYVCNTILSSIGGDADNEPDQRSGTDVEQGGGEPDRETASVRRASTTGDPSPEPPKCDDPPAAWVEHFIENANHELSQVTAENATLRANHEQVVKSYNIAMKDRDCAYRSVSRLAGRLAAAREALERIRNVGHNDDCMFCGFKDKEVRAVLDKEVGE